METKEVLNKGLLGGRSDSNNPPQAAVAHSGNSLLKEVAHLDSLCNLQDLEEAQLRLLSVALERLLQQVAVHLGHQQVHLRLVVLEDLLPQLHRLEALVHLLHQHLVQRQRQASVPLWDHLQLLVPLQLLEALVLLQLLLLGHQRQHRLSEALELLQHLLLVPLQLRHLDLAHHCLLLPLVLLNLPRVFLVVLHLLLHHLVLHPRAHFHCLGDQRPSLQQVSLLRQPVLLVLDSVKARLEACLVQVLLQVLEQEVALDFLLPRLLLHSHHPLL